MQAERNDDSVFRPPPEGVLMYDYAKPMRFGLESIIQRTVDRNPGPGEQDLISGTTLVYEPGFIRVDVNQQDIPAEYINRIGELAVAVQDTLTLQEYLRGVSHLTERAINNIRYLAGYTGGMDIHTPMEEIKRKAEGILQEGTGFSRASLEERQRVLGERLLRLGEDAYVMGVIIFDRIGVWNYIVRPPVKPEASED